MEDKELVCEYCKVPIKETDHKCPNCGANCTKVINDYKKQKKEKQDLINKNVAEYQNKMKKRVTRSFRLVSMFVILIIIVIIGLFGFAIYKQTSNTNTSFDWSEGSFVDNEAKKKVTVKYQEEAKTKDISVTLDSYELYEYKNDKFPNDMDGNTKPGFQKVAFHFIIKNNTKEVFDTRFDAEVSLTADDYKVDSADLEKCYFCYTAVGKDSYQNLYDEIAAGEKLQGYAGFLVPKDKEKLKFKVGDNIIINMDNPAYEK